MNARIGRVEFQSGRADDVVNHVRENVVPRLEGADGFKGFTLLIDRSGGVGLGLSFWESEEAMRASESISEEARSGAASAGEGSDQGREQFEVAIDTMA